MIEPDMRGRVQSGTSRRRHRVLTWAVWLGVAALSGATVVRAADNAAAAAAPSDRWEHFNRTNYAIQQTLERTAIRPLTRVYRAVTPGPIGRGIHNVLVNLSEPAVLVNDLLQLRMKRAVVPVARLTLNSTIGVLGLFDVAAHMGLPHHDNEFGVTLGRYGVSAGPYLYVPLIGPSSPRDLFGVVVDFAVNPLHSLNYPYRAELLETQFFVGGLDLYLLTEAQRDALLSGAVDPYATLRSAFIQSKQSEIEGSGVPLSLPSLDDLDSSPPTPPGSN